MIFWTVLVSLGIAYVLQFLLTMIQMKDFNLNFRDLRKMGRVAIGKKKGGFVAGSIVMFAIDDKGIILKGMYLSGVTVLARFKEINDFNGVDISTITEEQVKSYSKQVQKSLIILDLFSRMVLSYRISDAIDTILSLATFEDAFQFRKPQNLIFHSDQGVQYPWF